MDSISSSGSLSYDNSSQALPNDQLDDLHEINQLANAILKGDVLICNQIAKRISNINITLYLDNGSTCTLLHAAIKTNNLKIVQILLKNGAIIDEQARHLAKESQNRDIHHLFLRSPRTFFHIWTEKRLINFTPHLVEGMPLNFCYTGTINLNPHQHNPIQIKFLMPNEMGAKVPLTVPFTFIKYQHEEGMAFEIATPKLNAFSIDLLDDSTYLDPNYLNMVFIKNIAEKKASKDKDKCIIT